MYRIYRSQCFFIRPFRRRSPLVDVHLILLRALFFLFIAFSSARSSEISNETLIANQQLIEVYKKNEVNRRNQGMWSSSMPPEVLEGIKLLKKNSIPLFVNSEEHAFGWGLLNIYDSSILRKDKKSIIPLREQAKKGAERRRIEDVILQEYLRGRVDDGMPWLPASWTIESQHIERDLKKRVTRDLEETILMLGEEIDKKLIVAFLFSGVVPHSNEQDLIVEIRDLADKIHSRVGNFLDLRNEIHQNPSLETLRKVKAYIKANSAGNNWGEIDGVSVSQLLVKLKESIAALFGGQSLERFLNKQDSNSDLRKVLSKSLDLLNLLRLYSEETGKSNKSIAELKRQFESDTVFDDLHENLKNLGKAALAQRTKIFDSATSGESIDTKVKTCIDNVDSICTYDRLDLLRVITTTSFTLTSLLHRLVLDEIVMLSLKDFVSIVKSLTDINFSIGLMGRGDVNQSRIYLEEMEKGETNAAAAIEMMNWLENRTQAVNKQLRGLFAYELEAYKKFVPTVDLFIDATLRSTPTLPMSNFLSLAQEYLQRLSGRKIVIGEETSSEAFRILNPGIAKGRLIVVPERDLQKKKYHWDPNTIYVLPKTPASLEKVAGVITGDSGSMISHVQLLATNHGLPNIFVSQALISKLKNDFHGEEVLIYGLPNGEAVIKKAAQLEENEKAAYQDYQNIKEESRITLPLPEGLGEKYNKLMWLHDLGIKDSGKIAGGKACGQGELSQVFKDSVPPALVLPFAVYHEHIRRPLNGEGSESFHEKIERLLKDPRMKLQNESGRQYRARAFAIIQDGFKNLTLEPKLVLRLKALLKKKPFVGADGRSLGLFVRSDTNAEDLPNFVGAGLNKTVPNVRGLVEIIKSIKAVWASPYREKSFTWRQDLIDNPWDIYPSVIIQVGVPSIKSGVMIVGDPMSEDRHDTVYIASNEGIGQTVVNGEASSEEIRYSRSHNTYQRLHRSYARERKILNPGPGKPLLARPILGFDPIIREKDAKIMAEIGDKIQKHLIEKYGPAYDRKWDMEFGFIESNKIWDIEDGYGGIEEEGPNNEDLKKSPLGKKHHNPVLFQIRTFVGNKMVRDSSSLLSLQSDELVNLNEQLISTEARVFGVRNK